MYANKVNGSTLAGESLTSQLDFFTFTSPVNILTSTTVGANAALSGSTASQAALDKLVEIISLRGQPIIINAPSTPDGVNYTFTFATEHTGQWSAATLANAVQYSQTNATTWAANAITITINSAVVMHGH